MSSLIVSKLKLNIVIWTAFIFSVSFAKAQGPTNSAVELENPLKVNSITELLVEILNIVIVIATPIVIFFIIYAGFMYVTAKGNAANVEKAHKAITYALIGGVIIIGAVAIGEIIGNVVESFKK